MRAWKRAAKLFLALCLAFTALAMPQTEASAKATVDSSVQIVAGQTYNSPVAVVYSKGDAKLSNIKSSSKNLLVRQTYQYYHASESKTSEYPYGYANLSLYAKKPGSYTVTFNVCDESGKKVSSHKVKVFAAAYSGYTSPVKKVTFAGKTDLFYSLTSKKSGKFKVTMNSGYRLKSIAMSCYNAEGDKVTKTIKNNANVALGRYTSMSEDEYSSSYSDYWSYYMYSSMFATTTFEVTYQNTKTKAVGTYSYILYRIPEN